MISNDKFHYTVNINYFAWAGTSDIRVFVNSHQAVTMLQSRLLLQSRLQDWRPKTPKTGYNIKNKDNIYIVYSTGLSIDPNALFVPGKANSSTGGHH